MKNIIILIMIIFPLPAGAESDLLNTLDTLLLPPQDVITEIHIVTFNDTGLLSEKTYTCITENRTGEFLLICSLPLSSQGLAYVKNKDGIWAYTPFVRTFFPAGYYDSIEGTAARIEDFLCQEYEKYYTIQARSKTEVNREPVVKLTLKSKSGTAPYDRILLWVHEKKMLIVRKELYDSGMHLLKTIRYSGYREKDGWYQPSKILITDVLQNNTTSLLSIKSTTLSPVPEYVFTRSFVEFITR
ncbi:MAG: outer membrane lipoprotein-sorting protein [Spirochaetales bacterium]|nr:outer membrane lipoprotein-sorting protein [Spirochaetales bacterium]